jgi:hypothetical protein
MLIHGHVVNSHNASPGTWPATKPFEMFIVNPERTNAHDRTLNPNKIIQG